MPLDATPGPGPRLLSDADVGFDAAPKLLSDADVGFKEAPATASPTSAGSVDEYGRSAEPLAAPPDAPKAVGRIAEAAAEGWQGGSFQKPEIADKAAAENDQTLVGKYLVNPLVAASNVPFRAMGAVGGGLSQAATEVGSAVGSPELGRDLNMLAQVAPLAHVPGASPVAGIRQALTRDPIAAIGAASDIDGAIAAAGQAAKTPVADVGASLAPAESPQLRLLQQTEGAILRRVDGDETRLTPAEGVRLDNLRAKMAGMQGPADDIPTVTVTAPAAEAGAGGLADEVMNPPGSAPAGPPSAEAQAAAAEPQSAGAAATSRDTTGLALFGRSARELKGQAADMELADLMRTPKPNDARDIIPGATQTRAEIELNPDVSRAAKGLRQEFREGFNDHEKANNEIYHTWVDDLVPPREQVAAAKDVREARWQEAERTVFGSNPNGEPVSTAPIVQHLRDVFDDPIEKSNSYAKRALQPFVDALTDDAGAPVELGAKELYGIRQEMGRKVKDMATDTDLAHLRSQFRDLMDVTDQAITTGAPDYRTMMDEYRTRSMAIDAAERLQDIKLKITNGSDRTITFGALDRYMKTLWMERHGPNPYAPAKSIPQDVWDRLMMLHERLARSASADELARTKGSDTTQLMMQMIRTGALGVAHAAGVHFTGGIGNIAIPYLTRKFDESRGLRAVQRELNPDPSQYPTPGP